MHYDIFSRILFSRAYFQPYFYQLAVYRNVTIKLPIIVETHVEIAAVVGCPNAHPGEFLS